MLTYRQISLKLIFAYKLSYKKYKSVNYRVIGSFFRRQQLIKDRGAQWYQKHKICNWFVEENKFGVAIFRVRYFFWTSILLPVLFSYTFWKEIICLFYKSLQPFLTSVNYEDPYLTEEFIHILCPCFDIVFAPRSHLKNKE